ncbi:hypothetical protein RA263_28115, partial [Pseudomonas syringae pv. tagetis]|uniref:hypothetical protein n=1 Tax=Pseudomonas syringae group genomosp. 7 TaxID=251699 RepID=UPI00376FFD32
LRLIRLAQLEGFVGALNLVWPQQITVFAYLDNIILYENTSGTGANMSMLPISMSDYLGAGVIIDITFVLSGNLPGLLEVQLLSRMNLP